MPGCGLQRKAMNPEAPTGPVVVRVLVALQPCGCEFWARFALLPERDRPFVDLSLLEEYPLAKCPAWKAEQARIDAALASIQVGDGYPRAAYLEVIRPHEEWLRAHASAPETTVAREVTVDMDQARPLLQQAALRALAAMGPHHSSAVLP